MWTECIQCNSMSYIHIAQHSDCCTIIINVSEFIVQNVDHVVDLEQWLLDSPTAAGRNYSTCDTSPSQTWGLSVCRWRSWPVLYSSARMELFFFYLSWKLSYHSFPPHHLHRVKRGIPRTSWPFFIILSSLFLSAHDHNAGEGNLHPWNHLEGIIKKWSKSKVGEVETLRWF